jgi:hypothetical protein
MIDSKPMSQQQAIQKKYGLNVGGMTNSEFESYMTGKGKKFVNQYDLFGPTPAVQQQQQQQQQSINPYAPGNTDFNFLYNPVQPWQQQQQSTFYDKYND